MSIPSRNCLAVHTPKMSQFSTDTRQTQLVNTLSDCGLHPAMTGASVTSGLHVGIEVSILRSIVPLQRISAQKKVPTSMPTTDSAFYSIAAYERGSDLTSSRPVHPRFRITRLNVSDLSHSQSFRHDRRGLRSRFLRRSFIGTEDPCLTFMATT